MFRNVNICFYLDEIFTCDLKNECGIPCFITLCFCITVSNVLNKFMVLIKKCCSLSVFKVNINLLEKQHTWRTDTFIITLIFIISHCYCYAHYTKIIRCKCQVADNLYFKSLTINTLQMNN